jgi:hypothetical protein
VVRHSHKLNFFWYCRKSVYQEGICVALYGILRFYTISHGYSLVTDVFCLILLDFYNVYFEAKL